jgi:hypothetical protein
MWKSLAAVATAALVAGAITGFPDVNFVLPVSATSSAGVKAIPAPTCPNRGWPYRQCGTDSALHIRLVTTDRLN